MYKRYYDGYPSDVIDGNAVIMPSGETQKKEADKNADAPKGGAGESQTSVAEVYADKTVNGLNGDISVDGGLLAPFGLGNTKTDDLILIGVLIILLTESDSPDMPLLLIVAFIFLSGYVI